MAKCISCGSMNGCDCKMSKGGKVKGVHKSAFNYPIDKEDEGLSDMGVSVRRGDMEGAKKVAYDKIKEGRNVAGGKSKKPLEGLADGGEVTDQRQVAQDSMRKAFHFKDGGKVKGFDMDGPESKEFMDKGAFTSESEGGEVDNELMDVCCDELLSAIEKKDKKEILESLKAIILSVKG